MNYRMIKFIVGKMLLMEGVLLLIPAFVSLLYQESSGVYFLIVTAALLVLSLLLSRKPEDTSIYAKEGFVVVALAWLLWSAFGALPFVISGCIPKYHDAFFEVVSGFTTTGSTILTDIEALPMGMNFWRCFTHWIGGMGVLVFVMTILPLSPKNSMFLMKAEMPGPTCDKLVPKARSTARLLYGMYLGLSVLEVLFLLAGGMNLYDALVHTFSTAGTGGFDNRNANVAFYDSAYIDGVITVFMLMFGVNFSLYYLMLLREFKSVWKSEELRAYLGIVAAAIALITGNILHLYGSVFKAFRYASFQVASIITTTGFVTANFDLWPEFSRFLLLLLMFIGACAGSTGGAIKCSRLLLMFRSIRREIRQIIHPREVHVVKLDGHVVDEDTLHSVHIFIAAYILITFLAVLLVSLDNFSFGTNFSAVVSCIGNVGPGLEGVGPMSSYAAYSGFSKLVLSLCMIIGRLEVLPVMVLFSASAWKRS